jgi:hypothetical protein
MTSASSASFAKATGASLREMYQNEIQYERERLRIEKEKADVMRVVLKKATDFYKVHQPFQIASSGFFTSDNLNNQRETVDISITMSASPLQDEFMIINQLVQQAEGLGFINWPFRYNSGSSKQRRAAVKEDGDISKFINFGVWDMYSEIRGYSGTWYDLYADLKFTVVTDIFNDNGKKLKRISFPLGVQLMPTYQLGGKSYYMIEKIYATSGSYLPLPWYDGGGIYFDEGPSTQTFTAKVDDLTDNLTLKIVSVNGKSVDSIRRSGYVGIPHEMTVLGN